MEGSRRPVACRICAYALAAPPLRTDSQPEKARDFSGSTPVRLLESSVPAAIDGAADQVADFGAPPASFEFTVVQVSPVLGVGHAAEGAFHG